MPQFAGMDLLQIVQAHRLLAGLTRVAQSGEQQRRQDGDDRDNDEQLDEREAPRTPSPGAAPASSA